MGNSGSLPAAYAERVTAVFAAAAQGKPVCDAAAQWALLLEYNASPDNIAAAFSSQALDEIIFGDASNIPTIVSQCVFALGRVESSSAVLLHALRIITRVMPHLYTRTALHSSNPQHQQEEKKKTKSVEAEKVNQWLFEKKSETDIPLGVKLLSSVLDCFFLPGFTVSSALPRVAHGENVPLEYSWGGGVGIEKTHNEWANSTAGIISNRIEVIQCLLAIISQNFYLLPSEVPQVRNLFLEHLVSGDMPQQKALFCSLINSLCTFDPVGWGIPYNHLMYSERPEDLLRLASETIDVLLSHFNPEQSLVVAAGEKQEKAEEKKKISVLPEKNIFVALLRGISKESEFSFLYKGITTHITNHLDANYTYLPFSRKSDECYCESLVLLWRLFQENKQFASFVLSQQDVCMRVVVPLLCYVKQGIRDASGAGLLRLCEFILLCISEDRLFGVACNAPAPSKCVLDDASYLTPGSCFADLIIYSLHSAVTGGGTSAPKPSVLLESFLTVLANISPYVKSLSMQTAFILSGMIASMVKPRFIKNTDRSFLYISLLLESVNNILQYEYAGNISVLYGVLRAKKDIIDFNELTFDSFSEKIKPKTDSPAPEVSSPANARKKNFKPSQEWFDGWKSYIPLGLIVRIIETISPQLEKIVHGDAGDEVLIQEWLSKTTLVGILPVPHPIVTRKQQFSLVTLQWLVSYTWGLVFLSNLNVFESTDIKLFIVNSSE
eukprot:TRINITY_DN25705_c0_g1_i1.p1 TRINITY_DN25705_c0_g1~~TRINITY_DN25705_c0_g1_i1.p1  ORF type:complete len:730 (-),score=242.37 TRINITY_DN25705_c0_g1_i1:56-2224(-)